MNDDDERRRAGTRVRRQVLGDAHVDLLGPQPRDRPGELGVVRQVDAETALGDRRQLVPVVVERRIDVDRDAHGF